MSFKYTLFEKPRSYFGSIFICKEDEVVSDLMLTTVIAIKTCGRSALKSIRASKVRLRVLKKKKEDELLLKLVKLILALQDLADSYLSETKQAKNP